MSAPDPVVVQYLSLTDAMGYDSTSNLSPEEWAADLVKRAAPVVQPVAKLVTQEPFLTSDMVNAALDELNAMHQIRPSMIAMSCALQAAIFAAPKQISTLTDSRSPRSTLIELVGVLNELLGGNDWQGDSTLDQLPARLRDHWRSRAQPAPVVQPASEALTPLQIAVINEQYGFSIGFTGYARAIERAHKIGGAA